MLQKITLKIDGMTCQSCASRLEKVLNKKDFIQQAGVNFATEEAQVEFDDEHASPDELLLLIQKTGFQGSIKTETQTDNIAENKMSLRLWLLLLINVPFLLGMAGMLFQSHALMLPEIWQFILATLVQFGFAIPFYRSAIASIKGGLANMDVLVSLGTLTIYFYSSYMLFATPLTHSHVYFEAGVMVIGFVSLGKFLEDRTKKHSLNSLSLLLQLTPKKVRIKKQEEWQICALEQVQIDDLLWANQGERIAADGVLEQGNGWLDESHLTGESAPREVQSGDSILAGSIVTEGSLIYRAKQLGSQTLLGDMMNALAQAQGSKAPIARFADRVAAVFVPLVLAISLLTFLLTLWLGNKEQAVIHAVAVLVIACPCALGLATPAAIMVGMGRAVNAGVWFKDAAAMETAASVNMVVLDKTGTLTKGKPEIVAVWQPEDCAYSQADLYRFAAAIEQNAHHPLAQSIVQQTQQKNLVIPPALSIQTDVGAGIQGDVQGVGRVKVGKADYCHLSLPDHLDNLWQIASIVAAAVNEQPIGAFALADPLKEDSKQAIQRLKQQHIDVCIMSGDRPPVVEHIARQLAISSAFGNMNPREKADEIQRQQALGKVIAMVGDGVNDSPALAMANVSFAMKTGADIAQHSASATLMQYSVNQMVDALLISQATLKNIKQNLFFALIYNVLGIPLAALGYLNPVIAGAAMAMSSISVLMNALRLKRVKINKEQ